MSGSEAAFESTVEHFGPRRDPAARAIMVGVDGSDTAMRAAAFAFGMARRQGSLLIVAFVAAHSALAALTGPAAAAAHDVTEKLHAELRSQTRAAAEELGVSVAFLRAYGDPFSRLREAADASQVDTVVVGASTSAGHRFAGSVATKLIRTGHWPVLVVP
jgi:nucleotide-binding universal stress UspA family protein